MVSAGSDPVMHGLLTTCLQNSQATSDPQLRFSDMKSRKKMEGIEVLKAGKAVFVLPVYDLDCSEY